MAVKGRKEQRIETRLPAEAKQQITNTKNCHHKNTKISSLRALLSLSLSSLCDNQATS